MDPIRNPYTPNAGAPPAVLVGRGDQLQSFDLLLARLERGRSEQSMIITGLRGVGKTVLLGEFRSKALAADWVVVEVEVGKHDEPVFRSALAMAVPAITRQIEAAASPHEFDSAAMALDEQMRD